MSTVTRCGQLAGRKVSPYGDSIAFELPQTKHLYKISFANTPTMQRFEIEDQSASVQPPSTNMTRAELSRLIEYIRAAVGAPPPKSLDPYWDFLEDAPYQVAEAAVKMVVMNHKTSTFPRPSTYIDVRFVSSPPAH